VRFPPPGRETCALGRPRRDAPHLRPGAPAHRLPLDRLPAVHRRRPPHSWAPQITYRHRAGASHDDDERMSPGITMHALPPLPPSRVLLLVNPNARSGSEGVEAAVETLEAGGIRVRVETFTGPDEVETDIERAAGDADCVAVAGGDGTLSRAGGVLARKGLPL